MRKIIALILGLGICSFVFIASAEKESAGEAAYNEHCAACHPGGGNIIAPAKTLQKKDLDRNGLKTPEDIIKSIRNPGPGMTAFDKEAIPDEEARDIAAYVLRTFK